MIYSEPVDYDTIFVATQDNFYTYETINRKISKFIYILYVYIFKLYNINS